MFCEKCGAQMDNDSKFCLNCGAQATPQAAPAAPVAAPSAPAGPSFFSNKKNVLILAIVAAVLVVGVIVGIVIANLPATIYMDDFITIEYEGLSTKGYARMDFNYEAFLSKLKEEMTEQEAYTMMARMQSSNSFLIDMEAPENLANGDTIHILFSTNDDLTKEYGVVFKLKNETVTVSALREPIFLDLFADIELTFSGCSPYADVELVNNSTNAFILEEVSYYISNKYDLEEGETFTVEAYVSEYEAEEQGYIITATSKEYTATNLPQPTELNPFDYVTVTFTGLAGEGKVKYTVNEEEVDFMSRINFTFNKSSGLSEGDVVTLAFSHSSYVDPLEYGYKLTETTTQQYTVPKLGQYITDFTQLTESGRASAIAGALEEAKLHLTKESENNNTNYIRLYNTGFSSLNELSYATNLGNVKLHSVVSAQDVGWFSTTNYVYFIFTVDITGHSNISGGNGTGYFFLYESNPIMKGDGTFEFDFENDSLNYYSYCFLSYEDLAAYRLNGYDTTTIYTPEA